MRGESYGLEIIDRVHNVTGGKVKLVQGSVYPLLRSLENDGLLKSWDGPPIAERGGRPRRYYELTALGRRAATEEAKALVGLLKPALGRAT